MTRRERMAYKRGIRAVAGIVRRWGWREGVGFKSYLSKDAQDIINLINRK